MKFDSNEALMDYCRSTGKTYCFFSIAQNGKQLGSFTVELYTDVCPATCANFVKMVKGDGQHRYHGTPIHRVAKGGWVQGGDVVDGSGKGDPGFTIPDETFAIKHDAPGVLAMATNGKPHTANTQFYISLNPLPFLDGKRVAFGRVINDVGMDLVRSLQDLPAYQNERPVPDVVIESCHVLYEP